MARRPALPWDAEEARFDLEFLRSSVCFDFNAPAP